jgi:aspartate dehydrogenase
MKSIAIAGLGAIGLQIAGSIASIPGIALVAVADHDEREAAEKIASLGLDAEVRSLESLPDAADIVVEALPAAVAAKLYPLVIAKGKTLVALSSSVLLQRDELTEMAAKNGARIIVPSGAVGGLDALKAAKEGQLHSVRMITRKSPRSLAGAPHVVEQKIDLAALTSPTLIFSGNALDAARAFPANVNVVAAVSLAGMGPTATQIEVWADPSAVRNSHTVQVKSDSTEFEIQMTNLPSQSNPRSSQLACFSAIAALRDLAGACRVGT